MKPLNRNIRYLLILLRGRLHVLCATGYGLLASLVTVLVLSGCSHPHSKSLERELVHRSSQKHPQWIARLPSNDQYFYALGISTDSSSLRQGRQLAAKSAVVEVSNYLGLKASGRFEVRRTELTTRIFNEMSVTTSANLKRSRLTQMYYEEFRYEDNEENAHVFDVYILLRIPMADLKQELEKQQQKKNKILSEADAISREAQNHLSAGNFPLAWHKWMLAMRLIDEETDDKVSSLKTYKALLTAVEGISLSVDDGKAAASAKSARVTVRAVFSSSGKVSPLKDLPLHLRFTRKRQAGLVRNTSQSGEVGHTLTSSTGKGLQVRLMMSPYTVDVVGLSSGTAQKIQFLKSMLENKMAQYGGLPAGRVATAASTSKQVNQPGRFKSRTAGKGLAYTEGGSLINVDAATNNPYILLNNQQRYRVTMKVDIKASQVDSLKRPPLNLVVVLDKSGSMNSDGKIGYTKKATEFLIDHLSTQDYLAIVAYSSDVEVVVPSELVSSKTLIKHHLAEIEAGGMTNLSGGLFEGHTQVKKHLNENGINSILLLSDGIANRGITNTKNIIPYIKQYNEEGIGVSALGVGLDYNDELMIELAENSKGNYYYIKNPEDIPGIFSQELTRLINVAVQNIKVSVQLSDGIMLANSFGRAYTLPSKNNYEFRLGDLNYDDRGMLLLELSVPSGVQGNRTLANVEVSYNDVSSQENIDYQKDLSITYTRDVSLYNKSINLEVDKYIVLTRSIEELERVLESLDRGLYEAAIRNIRKTYASIEVYARGSEDAEFLQRLKLLKHFEQEVLELQESGELHGHDEDRRKNLSYKLYLEKHSHRTVEHPLHFGDE